MHCFDIELKESKTVNKIAVESKAAKGEVTVMILEDGSRRLCVGDESIEISDFTVKSSANGEAELTVTIKGIMNLTSILMDMQMSTYKLIEPQASSEG